MNVIWIHEKTIQNAFKTVKKNNHFLDYYWTAMKLWRKWEKKYTLLNSN